MKVQNQIGIKEYRSGGFVGKYQKLIREVVIPYQYSVLNDKAQDTEKSHVIQNFVNAGRAQIGRASCRERVCLSV